MGANKKVVRFDLATESDAICQPPRTMWVYLYRNHEERPTDYEAKLYLNSDYEVAFQPGGKKPRVGTGTGSVPGTGRR